MTSVSAGHIILTPTQPVGSGRPQRESNPGPPHHKQHPVINTMLISLSPLQTAHELKANAQVYTLSQLQVGLQ